MKNRWLILLWAALFVAVPGAAWAAPTASFATSRTSGVAPLAVHFDASGTTCNGCANIDNPWHDLSYKWDFGDSTAGTWAMSGRSKASDVGPSAAHVFEKPGKYTVKLTVYDAGGASASMMTTIDVADPEQAYAGAATYCYRASASSTFDGCPAGAQQKTNASFNAAINECKGAGHRCLFRRGDTFTASTPIGMDATAPGTIGAFGMGSKPLIDASALGAKPLFWGHMGGADYRVIDLVAKGPKKTSSLVYDADDPQTNVLFLRVDVAPDTWHNFAQLENTHLKTKQWHRYVFIVECKAIKVGMSAGPQDTLGGNILYVALKDSAILGNDFEDTRNSADSPLFGEHIIRAAAYDNLLIAHNRLGGAAGGKHVITLRSIDSNINNMTGCQGQLCSPSKKGIIQSNTIYARQDWAVQVCGKAGTEANKCEDTLVDGNFATLNNAYPVGTGGDPPSLIYNLANGVTVSTRTTFRNNICNLNGLGKTCVDLFLTSLSRAYNNTCYRSDGGAAQCIHGVGSPPAGVSTRAQNNLLYSNGTQTTVGGSWGTKGNNLGVTMSPFAGPNPGSGPETLKLLAGSAPVDAGTSVPNLFDYGRGRRVGQQDVGAWELGAVNDTSPVKVTLAVAQNPVAANASFTLTATAMGGSGTPDYKWDCDGDGTFEKDTNATASVSCSGLSVGTYNVGVQLTDASGTDVDNVSLEVTGSCGNGTREGSELCDGADLNGQTCSMLGYSGGTLACSPQCAGYDTKGCTGNGGKCGDGTCFGTDESAESCFQDCGAVGQVYAYDSTAAEEVLLYEDWSGQTIDYKAMASKSLGVLADCNVGCSGVAFVLDNDYSDARTTSQNIEPFSMGGDNGTWYFGIGCPNGGPCTNPLSLGSHHITIFPCSDEFNPGPWADEAAMRAACKGTVGQPKDIAFEVVDGHPPDGTGGGGGAGGMAGPGSSSSSAGGGGGGGGGTSPDDGGCGCEAAGAHSDAAGFGALAALLSLGLCARRRRARP